MIPATLWIPGAVCSLALLVVLVVGLAVMIYHAKTESGDDVSLTMVVTGLASVIICLVITIYAYNTTPHVSQTTRTTTTNQAVPQHDENYQ